MQNKKNEILFWLNPSWDVFLKHQAYIVTETYIYTKRKSTTCLRGTKQAIKTINSKNRDYLIPGISQVKRMNNSYGWMKTWKSYQHLCLYNLYDLCLFCIWSIWKIYLQLFPITWEGLLFSLTSTSYSVILWFTLSHNKQDADIMGASLVSSFNPWVLFFLPTEIWIDPISESNQILFTWYFHSMMSFYVISIRK